MVRTSLAVMVGGGLLIASLTGSVLTAASPALAAPAESNSESAEQDSTDPDELRDDDAVESDTNDTADESDDDGVETDGADPADEEESGGLSGVLESDSTVEDDESPLGEAERTEQARPGTAAVAEERDEMKTRDDEPTEQPNAPEPDVENPATGLNTASDAAVPAQDAVPPADESQGDAESPDTTGQAVEKTSAPVADATQSPPRSTLLSLAGSVVLNLIVGLIQLVDGPPMLPANSSVTVRTSSLTLPIGNGRSVQADWYFPEHVDETTRFVYLQHGFLASGPMYSYTAADLAERTNSIVVAPSLSSNFFAPDAAWVGGSTMHRAVADLFVADRAALTDSASAAAGESIILPDEFTLVGHSAGGTLVLSAAGYLTDTEAIGDLVGIVLLDGVEPAGSQAISTALPKLTGAHDKPIYLMTSDRYFWNRGGDMADKLHLARPDRFNGVNLDGGLHVDYMVGGNPLIQFAQYVVAGFSRPENVRAAGLITAGWVNDLFDGTTDNGVYGQPGERISIVTPHGVATARVLPLGYPARPVWPPLLDAALTAVFDLGGRYLFVYQPLPGFEPSVGRVDEIEASPRLQVI